jgi:hypothetical protein
MWSGPVLTGQVAYSQWWEIAGEFGGRDGGEEAADGRPELVPGPRRGLAQQRLEFGEEMLDRVQVGRLGRQVEERGACRREHLMDAGDLVRSEVVEHHDVAGGERWRQNYSR